MLAHHAERLLCAAWPDLLIADEDQDAETIRDPVVPSQRSVEAQAARRHHPDGVSIHGCPSPLADPATIVHSIRRTPEANAPGVTITPPTPARGASLS